MIGFSVGRAVGLAVGLLMLVASVYEGYLERRYRLAAPRRDLELTNAKHTVCTLYSRNYF